MNLPLWTIGHSGHSAEKLLGLLALHGVARVVDVRSISYGGRNPRHNKERMEASLSLRGIAYVRESEALGGKRDFRRNPEFSDARGRIDWMKVRRDEDCLRAMERLRASVKKVPTAVLCAEENPRNCYRLHLISAAWADNHDENISHIRGDGRVEPHAELTVQPDLFHRALTYALSTGVFSWPALFYPFT